MGYLTNFLIIIIFLIIVPMALAEETEGRIYTLIYSPAEPVVTEGMTISVGAENPDTSDHEYVLRLLIIKDGKIKDDVEFPFNLKAGKGISFSPTFTPDDIGEFEVIAKLYDKFEIELISSKLIKFNSISQIGPFDLEISIPSDVVRPNTRVPIVTQLLNMGEKGTDVEVKLTMGCTAKTSEEKFIVFLKPGQSLKKVTSINVCPEEGLKEVVGEIILFNKTWISSTSQVLLNSSYIELLFDIPETFVMKPGESKVFDLLVKNLGNKVIHNLQIVIGTLPQDWIKISPTSIIEIEPQETSIFVVNITIPSDAETTVYDFGISAAADETLIRKQTTLQISSLVTRKEPEVQLPLAPIQLPTISPDFGYYSLIPVGLLLSIAILKSITDTRTRKQRSRILDKIKRSIGRG